MTLKLLDVTEDALTDFFMIDPALCYLGLPDNTLHALYTLKTYIPNTNSIYKGVYEGDKLLVVVCYELYTDVSLNVHFYVSTNQQRKGLALEVQNLLYTFFISEYPHMVKVITTVPSPCKHVQRSAERFGMKLEGTVSKCLVWRKELVDILFYGLELKRENNA